MQPSLEMLMKIAELLDVDIRELIIFTKSKGLVSNYHRKYERLYQNRFGKRLHIFE